MPKELEIKGFLPKTPKDPLKNFEITSQIDEKSKQKYLKEFFRLTTPFDDLIKHLERIEQLRDGGSIQYTTIRQYRASLLFGLTYFIKGFHNYTALGDHYSLFVPLYDQIGEPTARTAYERVYDWQLVELARDNRTILDNHAKLLRASASQKAKSFDLEFFDRLMVQTHPKYDFLKEFVELNCVLGLRPSEWQSCTLVKSTDETYQPASEFGDFRFDLPTNHYWLKVKNGKNSFGRACGEYRHVGLDLLGAPFIQRIHKFLNTYKDKRETREQWDGFMRKQSTLLGEFFRKDDYTADLIAKKVRNWKRNQQRKNKCEQVEKKAGKYVTKSTDKNGVEKYTLSIMPTLYSTRHQAISNCKKENLHPILIASLFGHSNIDTSYRHYGRAVKGRGGVKLIPHNDNIMFVVQKLTPANIASILKHEQGVFDPKTGFSLSSINENSPLKKLNNPYAPVKQFAEPKAGEQGQNSSTPATADTNTNTNASTNTSANATTTSNNSNTVPDQVQKQGYTGNLQINEKGKLVQPTVEPILPDDEPSILPKLTPTISRPMP